MVIQDLDLYLHKRWILYRYDVCDRNVTQKQQSIQKFKTFLLAISLLSCIIRYLIYLLKSMNGSLPMYYFDVIHYIEAIDEMSFMGIIIFNILAISLHGASDQVFY